MNTQKKLRYVLLNFLLIVGLLISPAAVLAQEPAHWFPHTQPAFTSQT